MMGGSERKGKGKRDRSRTTANGRGKEDIGWIKHVDINPKGEGNGVIIC